MPTNRITGTDGKQYDVTYTVTSTPVVTIASIAPVVVAPPIIPTTQPTTQPTPQPPPATGWPDATNTGVSFGTVLTKSGPVTAKTFNAVISGLDITGYIDVQAGNITIQNCRINASGNIWGIKQNSGFGLKVLNCEIFGAGGADRTANHVLSGIDATSGLEVAFCNIHGCENAIGNGNGYIHDNFIHDYANWVDDHTDGIQTYGFANAGGLRVIHNTFWAMNTCGAFSQTNNQCGSSAVALSMGMHDLEIDNNFFAGGTYTLYGNAQSGGAPANTKVTNNHFSTKYRPKCGDFGTNSGFASSGPGFVWSGNVWHETGLPVLVT